MRFIHYHIKPHESGLLLLFVICYHYDCEVIVIDNVGIHPILMNGTIAENIAVKDQEITDEIYNDVIDMLNVDGIC